MNRAASNVLDFVYLALALAVMCAAFYFPWRWWGTPGAIGTVVVFAILGIVFYVREGGLATSAVSWPAITGTGPLVDEWNGLANRLATISPSPAWKCIAQKLLVVHCSHAFALLRSQGPFEIDQDGIAREPIGHRRTTDPALVLFFQTWNRHVRALTSQLRRCGFSATEIQTFLGAIRNTPGVASDPETLWNRFASTLKQELKAKLPA